MSRLLALLVAVPTIGLAAPAMASQIDFRTSAFSSANWQPSFVYTAPDGVTLTITPGPAGASLYQDSQDGLGVRFSYEADEIEAKETLTIEFSEEVLLTDVFLTDLFNEGGYLERGAYSLDGGSKTWFTADPSQGSSTNGELTLGLGSYATSITFSAPGKLMFGLQNHEFSLGSLSYTTTRAVPELDPNAAGGALLLLLGALAIASERRRTV